MARPAPRAPPRPLQAVALDDRHHLPGVDRHRRAPASRPSGTTAARSMIGTRPARRGTAASRADDRHQLPAVDGTTGTAARSMIGTAGTTFPAVDGAAPPSRRRSARAPRAPASRRRGTTAARSMIGTTRHHGHDRGRCKRRHGHRAARSMIGTTFPAVDGAARRSRGRSARRAPPRPLQPCPWPWMIGTSFPASIIGNRTAAVATRGPG